MSKHRLNRLSAIQIKTKPVGMHCDGGGLYLQVKHIPCWTWSLSAAFSVT